MKRTAVHGDERSPEPSPRVRADRRGPSLAMASLASLSNASRASVRSPTARGWTCVPVRRASSRSGRPPRRGSRRRFRRRGGDGRARRGSRDAWRRGRRRGRRGRRRRGGRARGPRARGGVDDEASDVGAERVARGERARGRDAEDDRAGGDGTEGDEAATDSAAPPHADVGMHLAAPRRARASRERRPRLRAVPLRRERWRPSPRGTTRRRRRCRPAGQTPQPCAWGAWSRRRASGERNRRVTRRARGRGEAQAEPSCAADVRASPTASGGRRAVRHRNPGARRRKKNCGAPGANSSPRPPVRNRMGHGLKP